MVAQRRKLQEDKQMKKLWLIRKDQEAVSPVIATILMVAITVVLAAVLYVMVSGILGGGTGSTKPYITFSASITQTGVSPTINATWTIASAGDPISAFSAYKVQMLQDGSTLVATAQALVAGSTLSFGATVKLKVSDLGGEGKLTAGDIFLASGMSSGHLYKMSLIWGADGSEVQSAQWQT
jgi:flagellin-like protein